MSERHDRDEIADVLLRYTVGIDRRDWKLFRTCFTDLCTVDYGDFGAWQGADALTAAFDEMHKPFGHTMHSLTNLDIRVDGDRAEARSYVNAVIIVPGMAGGFQTYGYYDDEIVRTASGWRIERRVLTNVYSTQLGGASASA